MKVKTRLRRFWRHNKKCGGMWAMLLQVTVILIPPYHFSDILFVLIVLIWFVVWKRDRQIDTMHRLIGIISRKYLRELFDHRNDLIDAQEELTNERAEHIECEKEKQELLKQLIELKEQTEKTE